MRRHSFIARLGAADRAKVPVALGTVTTTIPFVDGFKKLDHGLGQLIDSLGKRSVYPAEVGVDLALLAALVTAADTRLSRSTESQDSWTREIDLYIPVSDPARWSTASALLSRTLNFLTGDRWRLYFRERHKDYRTFVQRPSTLALGARFDCVCLFSGGLDSFVGAIDLLAAKRKPLFISHYWDVSTSSQEACAARIEQSYPDRDRRHVRARIGFTVRDFKMVAKSEQTQRGRSFLFFAMAALAASGMDLNTTVYVPENGLISLNVPLDALRVGAWSTRTTHPFYMARWNELLGVLGISATLVNPYRFRTKGEMLKECKDVALLAKFTHETKSCSSFSKSRYQKESLRHCGYCVPCLIRRASIEKALGPGNDSTKYTVKTLAGMTLSSLKAEGAHVRSFQALAERLHVKPGIAGALVRKPGPLNDYTPFEIADYAAVFKRGIEEVASLVETTKVRP